MVVYDENFYLITADSTKHYDISRVEILRVRHGGDVECTVTFTRPVGDFRGLPTAVGAIRVFWEGSRIFTGFRSSVRSTKGNLTLILKNAYLTVLKNNSPRGWFLESALRTAQLDSGNIYLPYSVSVWCRSDQYTYSIGEYNANATAIDDHGGELADYSSYGYLVNYGTEDGPWTPAKIMWHLLKASWTDGNYFSAFTVPAAVLALDTAWIIGFELDGKQNLVDVLTELAQRSTGDICFGWLGSHTSGSDFFMEVQKSGTERTFKTTDTGDGAFIEDGSLTITYDLEYLKNLVMIHVKNHPLYGNRVVYKLRQETVIDGWFSLENLYLPDYVGLATAEEAADRFLEEHSEAMVNHVFTVKNAPDIHPKDKIILQTETETETTNSIQSIRFTFERGVRSAVITTGKEPAELGKIFDKASQRAGIYLNSGVQDDVDNAIENEVGVFEVLTRTLTESVYYYRLKRVDPDGSTDYVDIPSLHTFDNCVVEDGHGTKIPEGAVIQATLTRGNTGTASWVVRISNAFWVAM